MSSSFMRVEDVARELDCKIPTAYKIIKKLNDELKAKGFCVMAGRLNKEDFQQKYYYKKQ